MLKVRRIIAGMSQVELANAAQTSYRNIQTWEKLGIEHATVENAKKVADALGCTIDELLVDPQELLRKED